MKKTIEEIMDGVPEDNEVEICARSCVDFSRISSDTLHHVVVKDGSVGGKPHKWLVRGDRWESYIDKLAVSPTLKMLTVTVSVGVEYTMPGPGSAVRSMFRNMMQQEQDAGKTVPCVEGLVLKSWDVVAVDLVKRPEEG